MARLDVLARRGGVPASALDCDDGWLSVGDDGSVRVAGRRVELSPLEGRLLGELARTAGRLVPADDLARSGWGSAEGASQGHVAIGVAWLRGKLGPAPRGGSPIETVRGFGYRYRPPA